MSLKLWRLGGKLGSFDSSAWLKSPELETIPWAESHDLHQWLSPRFPLVNGGGKISESRNQHQIQWRRKRADRQPHAGFLLPSGRAGRTDSRGQPRDSSAWSSAIAALAASKSTLLFSAWSFSPLFLPNKSRPVKTNPNLARRSEEKVRLLGTYSQ